MQIKKQIVIFFIATNLIVNAQNHLVGIKSGINNSYVTDNNTFKNKIGKNGFSGGITYDYLIKKKFALGIDLLYTQKGFGTYAILGDPLDPVNGGTGTGTLGGVYLLYFQYNYLTLPIRLSYTIGSKVFLFTAVSLAPSYIVNAKMYFEKEEGKPIFTNNLNKLELSGQIELGFGYQFKKRLNLYASVSKFQSFNGVSNSNYFGFSEITNYGYNCSAGINYIIKKKKKSPIK